jgi:two-component system, NtrC family, response regulator HydG
MASDQTQNRRRARVLVVDDDLACRMLAAMLLEQAGYAPTAVATVARALDRIDHEGADLVLTDLMLPGESGLDLLLGLHARCSDTPVIVMTGSDDAELIAQALDLGAATVLFKPYSSRWLEAAVGEALGGVAAAA